LERCCLKGYRGFVPDTELEVSGSKDTMLEERDRAGHGPKSGGSAIERKRKKKKHRLGPNSFIISKLLCQQMHSLLKHKMLQFTLKISLYMAPTCFGPFGPSSGSIRRNLAKVTVFVESLVKIHR
jgi:hypothetical protein